MLETGRPTGRPFSCLLKRASAPHEKDYAQSVKKAYIIAALLLLLAGGVYLALTSSGGSTTVLELSVADYGKKGVSSYRTIRLQCPGGDPDLCSMVEQLGENPSVSYKTAKGGLKASSVFSPVPADALCTREGGPPLQARIRGEIGDKQISAIFPAWQGGCEVARWNTVAILFEGMYNPAFASPLR